MTRAEKFRYVSRQTDICDDNVKSLIEDFFYAIDDWHGFTLDEDEYIDTMTVEEMETVVRLYRERGGD